MREFLYVAFWGGVFAATIFGAILAVLWVANACLFYLEEGPDTIGPVLRPFIEACKALLSVKGPNGDGRARTGHLASLLATPEPEVEEPNRLIQQSEIAWPVSAAELARQRAEELADEEAWRRDEELKKRPRLSARAEPTGEPPQTLNPASEPLLRVSADELARQQAEEREDEAAWLRDQTHKP